jgi:predicted RNA-binding Zn-ribbon protein involved in translation (DUF1610 family)
MALITCPECSKQISEFAASCPNCGFQLNTEIVSIEKQKQKQEEDDFYESLGGPNSQVKKESIGTRRKIKETKCKCKSCGKIWHYGKTEVLNSAADNLSTFGKDMMCCTGCMPALFIPDKKVTDLNKCPNCGSKAIYKKEVIHEI